MSPAGPAAGASVLFYDGVCGLCDRLVQFVLARDSRRRFVFAALQGRYARETLPRQGRNPDDLDSLYLLTGAGTPAERAFDRSGAVLAVLRRLPPPWSWLGALAALIPSTLRDRIYDAVARRRYRLFGRSETCRLPRPGQGERFLPLD